MIDETDTTLSDLLDRVERGEEVTIVRHGRAVANLKATPPDPERMQAVLDELWKLREQIRAESGPITTEEILELIREGRKY
ncbi:MAG: type II toxin-antitoxin system Phd/YefM family antitoxin [Acetobacteraceae bacterium]